jgi:tripartite-type tricarboxylate transporter receptor subunit TctC
LTLARIEVIFSAGETSMRGTLFWIFACFAFAGGVLAQGTTLRIIAYAPPGGPTDTLARGMLDPLGKALGQTIVIENRVGADGIIAAEACARSTADGQTLCSTGNSMLSLNPVIRAKLPYDPVRDFAGVVHVGFFDSLLLAHPSVQANTVSQLVDLARAKPDAIVWGHFGINTTGNFYQEYLKKSRQAPFYPVPYKTTGQVLQALLTGEAQVAVYAWPNVMSSIRAGKMKPLAVTSEKRLGFLPDVPTFAEEGIKLPLRGWFGYHVPAGTPRPMVVRFNTEIRKIMADPGYREKYLNAQGIATNDGTPEELDAFVKDTLKEMVELARFLGIRPD